MAVYPKFRNQAEEELKKIQQPLNNLPVNGDIKQPANDTQSLLMGQRPPRPTTAALQPQQQQQYSAQGLANPYMKSMPAQPPKQPDITQGEAYKTALQQSRDLLAGRLPTGIQAGESAQLEALKKKQGEITDQTREQYIKAGLGQSGAFVEGMSADKNQQLREQIALGRDQDAARANIQLQQQQQGMQGLQTLIGAEQAQAAQQAQERLSYANLSLEDKKLAQQGAQFGTEMEFKKWATEAGLDAEKQKLLWQSIENEKKIQSEEKLAFAGLSIEDKKIAQNAMQFTSKLDFDKYALQSGIDQEKAKMIWQAIENEKARLSAEKIAFADLDYKNRALAQEGMQFQSKLDFDKWATQAGLDMKQKEMIWQSGEAEKERLSRENMFYKELNTKERELLHRIGMDTSKLALEEFAVKEGFNQQQIDRLFKATEMEKDRQNALTLKNMDTDIEKWKTDQATALTKQGWTFQEAMAQKEIEAKKYLQEKDAALQREIEGGRLSMQEKQLLTQMSQFKDEMAFKNSSLAAQMSEAEKDRVWKTQERIQSQIANSLEADLDRQLQKQIESGRLSLQEKEMAQQATQFKDEMEFKKSQLASTLSEAKKDRIWKSKENALNLAHDANMKNLQMQMEKEGLNFQAMMKLSENLPPEQQAAFIAQAAKDAGMKYNGPASSTQTAEINSKFQKFAAEGARNEWNTYATSMGMSIDDANKAWKNNSVGTPNITQSGLKPLTPDEISKQKADIASKEWSAVAEKVAKGEKITQEELDKVVKSGNFNKTQHFSLEETWDARDSSGGYKAFRFTPETWEFINANKGKLIQYKTPDGKTGMYILESFWEPGESRDDRGKLGYVMLKDPITGDTRKEAQGRITS